MIKTKVLLISYNSIKLFNINQVYKLKNHKSIMALNSLQFLQSLPWYVLMPVSIWTLVWKGFALWKSARLKQPVWFIALLIINTLGILEILYLFLFSKMEFSNNSDKEIKKLTIKKNKRRSKGSKK